MSNRASLLFVLHAHLPFVNHPASSDFLEESWFFEAAAESYVPLIRMFERLAADHIRPGIVISVSPTLAAMLENEELKTKLRNYLETRLELLAKEKKRLKGNVLPLRTISVYEKLCKDALDMMSAYGGSLIEPLKNLQSAGQIEIITTAATHAVLPLIIKKESIRAQTATAAAEHKRIFGHMPSGIWLPECAYEPGLNPYLRMAGFRYFFAESHSLPADLEKSASGSFSSYRTSNGLDFFVRDEKSSADIWDTGAGYPSNPLYREFYRDIGYDADIKYIKPYLVNGERRFVGIKYHRITDRAKPLDQREYYDYDAAMVQIEKDAENFISKRISQAENIKSGSSSPVIMNCYNAELFGHWWFEGPAFLEAVLRKIRTKRFPLRFVTASEYLASCPPPAEVMPGVSSWGDMGYFDPWINESNDFIYAPLCSATEKMTDAANFFKTRNISDLQKKALNQAAREILLAQSSDWPFLIHINSHASYAKKRFEEHINEASLLLEQAISDSVNEEELKKTEHKDSIFQEIDFRLFASPPKF